MTTHVTRAVAEIEKEKNGEWTVLISGKTSGVSSGSPWGSCYGATGTFADAVASVKRRVQDHNEWCDSWQDSNGVAHRFGKTFKTILIVNGEKVPLAIGGQKTLGDFG